jgi:hypothetical protein
MNANDYTVPTHPLTPGPWGLGLEMCPDSGHVVATRRGRRHSRHHRQTSVRRSSCNSARMERRSNPWTVPNLVVCLLPETERQSEIRAAGDIRADDLIQELTTGTAEATHATDHRHWTEFWMRTFDHQPRAVRE